MAAPKYRTIPVHLGGYSPATGGWWVERAVLMHDEHGNCEPDWEFVSRHPTRAEAASAIDQLEADEYELEGGGGGYTDVDGEYTSFDTDSVEWWDDDPE